MRKQTKYWTCANGKKIRICDMTDTHLINTIKYLERKSEQYVQNLNPPNLQGDIAQYLAEQEYDAIIEDPSLTLPEIYYNLVDEMERRKLTLT